MALLQTLPIRKQSAWTASLSGPIRFGLFQCYSKDHHTQRSRGSQASELCRNKHEKSVAHTISFRITIVPELKSSISQRINVSQRTRFFNSGDDSTGRSDVTPSLDLIDLVAGSLCEKLDGAV